MPRPLRRRRRAGKARTGRQSPPADPTEERPISTDPVRAHDRSSRPQTVLGDNLPPCPELHNQRGSFSQRGIRCPVLQIDPRQRGRLIEIIQNLRERIREARGNGWLGEVEGLQVSLDAATAKLNSLSRAPADGRPQLVDLGLPVFTDSASPPQTDSNLKAVRAFEQER
ncbi:hypothetical protein GCM10009574_087960 [Streptomyces asiaticus]|uniref:Uncharacterized protein n=1 Tax=Streptomyces rhizosphaericus TaxID=114699 RepID=A0ABN1SM10_9ACTN